MPVVLATLLDISRGMDFVHKKSCLFQFQVYGVATVVAGIVIAESVLWLLKSGDLTL